MNEHRYGVLQAFRGMQPRKSDAWIYEHDDLRKLIEAQILNFPSFALPDKINPVCVFGIVPVLGIGEIWMVTGQGFMREARAVCMAQKQTIKSLVNILHLHRVCLKVEAENTPAKNYARYLGFDYEHTEINGSARATNLDVFVFNSTTKEK